MYMQPGDTHPDYSEPTSIPPGAVTAEQYAEFEALLERAYPPQLAALIRESPLEEVSIQPIYDVTVERYSQGRVLLIGDAGAITRPHTASGATKAIMDALVLEDLARDASSWDDVLHAYDAERTAASNAIVELSRRLGEAEVLNTPEWSSMSATGYESWLERVLDRDRLYVFADAQKPRGAGS
jgi:2-polyprenyl-6-methoxyphenol hydroxylase-like FAD-dependent oxidoreductase